MKVYIIKANRIGEDSMPFIFNVYASLDIAKKVYNHLIPDKDYVYYLSECDVIE